MKNYTNPYILLAKSAVETYINKEKVIKVPDDLPKEITSKKAGTFVTIKKNGDLRACIGTYLPTKENIAEEIIQNAITAATEDHRFGSVQEQELPYLTYSVYILEKPELVKDVKELNPKEYGIIIKTLNHPLKSALLLPDLNGIDTIEQQISVTCQKGGIDPSKEKTVIYKFKAEEYN
jgi:AmmeMemoRadiSam system protein A